MKPTPLHRCSWCATQTPAHFHTCILCGRRIDRPLSFHDKDQVWLHFNRGGVKDIVEALNEGEIAWDSDDPEHNRLLELAVILSMEECFALMDVMFFLKHPRTGGMYLGLKWPDSNLVEGLRFSVFENGRETLFMRFQRNSEHRGDNLRLPPLPEDGGSEFGVSLFCKIRDVEGARREFRTRPAELALVAGDNPHGLHEVVRKFTREKVC